MDATGKRNLSTLKFIDGIKAAAKKTKTDFTPDVINSIIDFCGAENLKNPQSAEFQAVKYLVDRNKPIAIPNIDSLMKSKNN
jgi:hypothetical protein